MLIHIGYHKTGTTWFQDALFEEDPRFEMPFSYTEIVSNLVYPNSLHFEAESVRAYFEPGLSAARETGRVPVLSAERLAGNPHSGGYDSGEIADRLAEAFPRARVWIVIRNQVDVIASNYKQYVRENGTGKVEHYLKGDPPERIPSFDFRYFEYDHLIRHYRKLFGSQRVLVSLYEDFASDPRTFVNGLYSFLDMEAFEKLPFSKDANYGFSDTSISALRVLNLFSYYPSMAHYPLINLPGRRQIRRALRQFDAALGRKLSGDGVKRKVERIVGDYYVESNKRLGELLEVDLKARGYTA